MESYQEKKEYKNLTPEENKILSEVNALLFVDRNAPNSLDKFMKRQKMAKDFIIKLEDKGYNPLDYLLWHRVIGSTPQDGIEKFDTPEKDIEKFVRDFEKEYEENNK